MPRILLSTLLCWALGLSPLLAQLHNKGATVKIQSGAFVKVTMDVQNTDGGTLQNQGTLTTAQSLSNTTGATLSGNGIYRVGADWTNSATFAAGSSSVAFEGAQNSAATSGGSPFYNVSLNKSGGFHLALNDAMSIGSTLDFQAAGNHLLLGNFNLGLGNVTGFGADRYITTGGTGKVFKNVTAAFTFPVGFDKTTYNPLTLTQSGTPDVLGVRCLENVFANGNTGAPLPQNTADVSWDLMEQTPGGSSLAMQFQWAGGDELAGFDRTMMSASRHDGANWLPAGGLGSASGSDPYQFLITGIAAPGIFALTDPCSLVDNTLPTITCPNPVTVICAGQIPAVNLAAVTATDNCGVPVKSHVGDATTNMTCANRKTVTRTYRATDGSGNSATCSQVITVFDNVLPVFTSVPANVTVQCNSIPAVGTPSASDGCGSSVSIVYNGQTTESGACTDAYTLTRQWTATDACGNTKTATQRITVIDTQKPNFTSMPANVTVQCDAIPAPAVPTATDNCDATVAITYNGQTQTSGACPNAYTLTRTWTAADNCGNTKTVTQRITVVDNGKPVFVTFPGNTTISCSENPPAVGTPTASDGCGSATVAYLGQTTTSGACPGNYQIKRSWRATDACGNSTVATQTIQVQDTGVPVFTSVPGPLTIECNTPLPPLVNPTASDACGGYVAITFLGNVPSGSGCAADYTVTRTWRAQDLCGNTATASQVITVQGNNYQEEGAENRADATRQTTGSRLTSVTLQPNPTTDRFWLDLSDFAGETVAVLIFSELGQLVWENRIPAVEGLKLQISLREAGAAAGIYTVSIRSARGMVAMRVVLVE